MALQSIKGGAWLPEPAVMAGSAAITYVQIDATGEKLALIVKAPKTGEIRRISILTGTVTTGSTLPVRIETVDGATGNPTGTLFAAGATANLVIASSDDNAWKSSANFAADVAVDADDLFAIVIEFGASANLSLAASGLAANASIAFPYGATHAASWTKAAYSPIVGIEYDDGSFDVCPGVYPFKTYGTLASLNTGTNPNEIALKFKLPFFSRVAGFWLWANRVSTAADLRVQLYEADNKTPLSSVTIDGNQESATGFRLRSEKFNAPVMLKPGVVYRLSVLPTTATSVSPYYFEVNSAALFDAFAGGQDFSWSQRQRSSTTDPDNAAWSDTTTRRPQIGLILDQFSDENLGYFDVTAFGAKGDGIADDTQAIRDAITAASATGLEGATVFIPQGVYLVGDNNSTPALTLAAHERRLIGDGTLKLKSGVTIANECVLKVTGNHCRVSGIRIDGNSGGSQAGEGSGLVVAGHYCHVSDVYASNTKLSSSSATFRGAGTHNLFEGAWSVDAGGDAFADTGDYNRYQDCTAKNWGNAGFHCAAATLTRQRLDIDGGYFEPGANSLDNNCLLFDGSSGKTQMVAIRNTVVDWPDNQTPAGTTQLLGKFARIDWLILDNCLFKHKNTATTKLTTIEIGANVKRAHLDHCFLSRQLKLASIDSDAIVMLVDTQIGDDQLWATPNTQPTLSVLGIAGAQFIARSSRFIGYSDAALELIVNLNTLSTFVHFEASDCSFDGYNENVDTYDVKVGGSGAVNASRKILWLNNRRSVMGGGSGAFAISTVDLRILFTTRDWSKRVYEAASDPTALSGITWQNGDTAMHTTPISTGNIGWVRTASGWKTFGTIT